MSLGVKMTDKTEDSDKSHGIAESEEGFVIVDKDQAEGIQNMDQPLKLTAQFPVANEGRSSVGPKHEEHKGMFHDKSKDNVAEATAVSQSSSSGDSKWKLEKIGETLCLKTDTEKIQLPYFLGKSNPKLYERANGTFILGSDGNGLEVRKDENGKLTLSKTKIPVSDTNESKNPKQFDESGDSQPAKLEKHDISDSDSRHLGTNDENSEMNKKAQAPHELQFNIKDIGDENDSSRQPKSSESKQPSITEMSTDLAVKTYVKEEACSRVYDNTAQNKSSNEGEVFDRQEKGMNEKPDNIRKESTDTSVSDRNENYEQDQMRGRTDASAVPLHQTDDSVYENSENKQQSKSSSLEKSDQQSVNNVENKTGSDRKMSTSENQLVGQFAGGTQEELLAKRDEIENVMEKLKKMTLDEKKTKENESDNIAVQINPLGGDLEDSQPKGNIREYPVSPFLELIVDYYKKQEDKQHLFSGIEVSFKGSGKDLVCVVKKEPDIPESAIDKILNLPEGYGKVDVEFKKVKHFDKVKNQEGMMNALLTDMSKEQKLLWKIDTASGKIFIASHSQPRADDVSMAIKKALDVRYVYLEGAMKEESKAKQLMSDINDIYGVRIQVDLDSTCWKFSLVGIIKNVASAREDIRNISKSVYVDSLEKLDFIESELEKENLVSSSRLAQITRIDNGKRMGFVLNGPSTQVCLLSKKIDEIQKDYDNIDVDIKDYGCLTYLSSSAGDDFIKTVGTNQNVNINRNWSNEMISKDMLLSKTHTLPTGHQIVLTGLAPTDLKVNFEVSEYAAEPSFMEEQNRIVVYIPKYNSGKEKQKFEMAMKQLLQLIEENCVLEVSICLAAVGGWSFTKLVKIVLYCLEYHMSFYLKTPSTVYLAAMEKYKEAEKVFSDAFPDLESDDSHNKKDDSQAAFCVDAWKMGLLKIQADALVYAVHPSLNLKEGNISAALEARAGPQLQDELRTNYKNRKLEPWEFVCTSGYKLPYNYVFHGALVEYKNLENLKDMQNFIFRCLERAEEFKLRKIVFPALGTGRCGYKTEDIAAAIYEASIAFKMKYPMSSLNEVIISCKDDLAHGEISRQLQTSKESKLFKIGKVTTMARLVSHQRVTAVMADSIVVFWEMKSFAAVRAHEDPVLLQAGSRVAETFGKRRDVKTGKTFMTEGGNFYPKKMIHIPYNDDESKLESAFEDGMDLADSKHCKSCILYFTETSPMFKYGDKLMLHILKAISNSSKKLSNNHNIVVLFEGENTTLLNRFEEIARKLGFMDPRQEASATNIAAPEINKTITISGSKENVRRAKEELESKIMELQKENATKEAAKVTAPGEMDISRMDRGLPDDQHDRVSSDIGEASRYPSKTDHVDMKPLKEVEALVTRENVLGVSAAKDGQLDKVNGSDSQQWRSSMLVHDISTTDSQCVEVGNIGNNESYDSLTRKLSGRKGVSVVHDLIYPFENHQKALLICQSTEDADKLNGFVLKSHPFTFTKLTAQCLQMVKVTIPSNFIQQVSARGALEKLNKQLEEIGVMESTSDDLFVNVTVFTLAQMKVLQEVLKNFEEKPTRKEPVEDDQAKPTGRPTKGPKGDEAKHEVERREKSPVRDGASLTRIEHKSSSSEGDMNEVEILAGGVNEMLWKVFICLNSDEVQKLMYNNVTINFKDGSIIIDGCRDEVCINRLKKEIDKLRQLQMEAIAPTSQKTKYEYDQWCDDFKSNNGKPCCVYDDENNTFIAFGETYDNIAKVKHQLNIKQGLIKQTGRRRNRNLESSTPSVMTLDTGPRSMPSFPASMSVPKHGCPDFSWSDDANQLEEYKTQEGIKVFVYVANILRLPVDCIVNAANATLQHGGGIAAVIERAAGYDLTREGDRHTKANGPVPVGMAFTTTAGNLPYDCVIHAVGPRWGDYRPHTLQNVKQCESLLQNAILSSFKEAEMRNLKTIALPAISSAIFSVPEEMCAVQYAKAILRYSSGTASDTNRLQEIHFIDKNPKIISLIQTTFKTMIEDQRETDYDIMKYVTQQSQGYGSSSGYSRSVRSKPSDTRDTEKPLPVFEENAEGCVLYAPNGSRVYVYDGNILEAHKKHITAIVCADDNTGRGKGGVANALMSHSHGFNYKNDKNDAFNRKQPNVGDIVLSAGQGTGYVNVLHAVLWGSGHVTDQKTVVLEAYKNVIKEASWRKLSSIAMPILGTGSYKGITIEESTNAFMTAYLDYCSPTKVGSNLTLYLVCQNSDNRTKVISVIRRLLQKEEPTPKKARDSSPVSGDITMKASASGDPSDKTCVICMEDITSPKTLSCGHTFCADCVNNYLDNYKQACPTCGKVCGIIKGDQPEGKMFVNFNKYSNCAGYEDVGRIDITYSFQGGFQKESHPEPGKYYNGITRTAYLPDNKEGREVLALLRIAFDRDLVFTIGRSRTTNKEGVITWNDIHHKTNPQPYSTFGYPDPGYLERVKDELAAKGVTVDDIPQLSATRGGNRDARPRRH